MNGDLTFDDVVAGFAGVVDATGVELHAGGERVSASEFLAHEGWLPLVMGAVYVELKAMLGSSVADDSITFEDNDPSALCAKRALLARDAPAASRVVVDLILGHVILRVLRVEAGFHLDEPGVLSGTVVDLNEIDWDHFQPSFSSSRLHRDARASISRGGGAHA